MQKKKSSLLSVVAALGLGLALGFSAPANASVFSFSFFDGNNAAAGSGTLSFDGSLADGSYTLDTLSNLAINFTVSGENFTLADNTTTLSDVLAVISDQAPGIQRLQISNDGNYDGLVGGAMDFLNGNGVVLAFAPLYFDPTLTIFATGSLDGSAYFGDYFATTAVPEPAMLSLFGLGLAGLGLGLSRRRKA